MPEPLDPNQTYQDYYGSSWDDDRNAVGLQAALPWYQEAMGGALPPEYQPPKNTDPTGYAAVAAALRASAASDREAADNTLGETVRYHDQYDKYLRDALAENARQSDAARAQGDRQFAEDLAYKREALLMQLADNEKNRQIQRKSAAQSHQAQSAQSTGYWMGPLGTGV